MKRARESVSAGLAVAAGLSVVVLGFGGGGGSGPGSLPIPSVLLDPGFDGFGGRDTPGFQNWESAHVHPLEMTPDGTRLLAVNTADNRLEVFDITGSEPVNVGSIAVGVDPVSVRARSNTEAWVVNHVGDNVSIVNLSTMRTVGTLKVADEPGDVIFAANKAFVTCMTTNAVHVFDLANLAAPATIVNLEGTEPRALAASPDGASVYAAFFRSGNGTTVLGGGATNRGGTIGFPPDAVGDPAGPYAGQNPPPNSGVSFDPPINPAVAPGIPVSLIVKRVEDESHAVTWVDDNSHDWTSLVSGANAALSGRPVGWDLIDHDVAIINPSTLAVTYAGGMLNINMAIAVNPATGRVTLVGTEALNHIRYEPVLKGRFIRVDMGSFLPGQAPAADVDLNPHLTYEFSTVAQTERDKSIGDPRAVVWNAAGTHGYIAGMGSNNVIEVDAAGARTNPNPINVAEGPTGLALDEAHGRLFVLSKFAARLSVIDTATGAVVSETGYFDPTPASVSVGRKHLYDTHKNSGLGHIACASCHVDGRMDRLAWDLGDPSGAMDSIAGNNLGQGLPGLAQGSTQPAFEDFHPMKGPMTTQTLQGIVGLEPFHWRGDRHGLENFAGAFIGLQGDDTTLTAQEMQEFEDMVGSITYPPNPFRNFDNTLPTNMVMTGHYTTGRFGPPGVQLPNGSASRGLTLYRSTARRLDANAFACVTCHTLPTGAGTDYRLSGGIYTPIAVGPMGEHHLSLVSVDGTSNITTKIPQFRNAYQKGGFNTTLLRNTAGFGFLHDGSVDSLERFIGEPVFTVRSDQEVADITALILAVTGSELPAGSTTNPLEPPGPPSKDTPASVGFGMTLAAAPTGPQSTIINQMLNLANAGKVGLVARATVGSRVAGLAYLGANNWQTDKASLTITHAQLLASASPANELTITVVPAGTQTRRGLDRDGDGWYDGDELSVCDDPANPASYPGGPGSIDANGDLFVDFMDIDEFVTRFETGNILADFNGDGFLDFFDFDGYIAKFETGC